MLRLCLEWGVKCGVSSARDKFFLPDCKCIAKSGSFSRSEVTFLLVKTKCVPLCGVPEATFLRGCPPFRFFSSALRAYAKMPSLRARLALLACGSSLALVALLLNLFLVHGNNNHHTRCHNSCHEQKYKADVRAGSTYRADTGDNIIFYFR